MNGNSKFSVDEFEQGFQYALYVLNERGVDVESLLGSNVFTNKKEHDPNCIHFPCTCEDKKKK